MVSCPHEQPQALIKAFRLACTLAVARVKELSVSLEGKPEEEIKSLLKKCSMTTLNSKLVRERAWWLGGLECQGQEGNVPAIE